MDDCDVGGVGACAMVALAGCGPNNTNDTRNLRLRTSGAVYFGKNTPNDRSTAYGPGDLGLGRSLPLSSLIADYQGHAGTTVDWAPDYPGAGTVSEAHVFIEDPQQTWDSLFNLDMSGNPSAGFSNLVAARAGGIGIVWPRWHGVTAPGGSRSSANLDCLEFYPPDGADTGTVVGCTVQHVQALRVNDRGGCATKTEMPAREFAQSLWCGFKHGVTGSGDVNLAGIDIQLPFMGDATRNANKVASVLTHEGRTAATNARGGFASYVDFEGDFSYGLWGRFYMVYGYRFALDNGILALGPPRYRYHTVGPVGGAVVSSVVDALTGNATRDARPQFKKSAQLSQAVPITDLDGNNVECTPSSDVQTVYDECNANGAVFPLIAGLGLARNQGLISGGPNGELDHLKKVIHDAKNWTCQADDVSGYYDPHNCIHYNEEPPPKPVCRLQLRAKRLNVYPDSVELVWFNGDQRPMTTAFALAKVLQATGRTEKLHDLCTPSPLGPGDVGSGPPDYYRESYIYDPDL